MNPEANAILRQVDTTKPVAYCHDKFIKAKPVEVRVKKPKVCSDLIRKVSSEFLKGMPKMNSNITSGIYHSVYCKR